MQTLEERRRRLRGNRTEDRKRASSPSAGSSDASSNSRAFSRHARLAIETDGDAGSSAILQWRMPDGPVTGQVVEQGFARWRMREGARRGN
jgi:hypothetical protein